MTVNMSENIW